MNTRRIAFAVLVTAILSVSIFSQQNRFEGYNIILDVPETQNAPACAVRYSPPATTVTITDLDRSTPLNVRACGGSNVTAGSGGSATLRSGVASSYWCFEGEDDSYRVDFPGDQYSGRVSYIWRANPEPNEAGFYNVRDFGAVGDGNTDDTLAIRSALAYLATRNGGILKFPEGDYVVGSTGSFRPLVIPSGVTIEGVSGLHTGASTNNMKRENPSRIRLKGTNRALFRIGECTESVVMRDIELIAESPVGTYGIEALGAYLSTQSISLERIVLHSFYRGFSVYGLPQTSLNWQVDYVKVKECRFIFNADAAIYTNVRNSNWRIEGSLFINPQRTPNRAADSMHFERVGAVLVEDTFGGGFPSALGGTFIKMLDTGPLTVIGSETEAMTESFVYNDVENPLAGDYSYPITFVNSVFGDPIIFKARRTFVSTGTLYGPNTFRADPRVRVYSTGDRFCYDGNILACRGATKENFGNATIIFMTGQPSEGQVQGHPTYFGTDVEFGSPVKMPSIPFRSLPRNKDDGSMVFCPDCRRDSEPCQGGGNGAPAMVVNGRWTCM
ncbi:MAG: hypothetical protein DWQ47_16655 [Acidobacteria bacterium]|nr:MAG: hypothetical protein DWQ32_04055 [Acidobacteriota bacterium]REK02324.1 MAG: hypothetical protein DWQ38_08095 [Acidobacteriota bacterium]REK13873.1 MAG: hypothetical protein DWQ43_09745 [Acidobacteriota bacterium]REK41868.1 MAG: hypothetical protein DWQ47_16655 [Acidobacteriota bacterium]